MRYFLIADPKDPANNDWTPVETVLSEQDILDMYWNYWSSKMLELNRGPIDFDTCIGDFCVVHWAVECDEFGNQIV